MTEFKPKLVPLKGTFPDVRNHNLKVNSLVDLWYTFDVENQPILTFSTAIANMGEGKLYVVIGNESVRNGERVAPAIQWVFNTEGGHREHNAGEFVFHTEEDGHSHWHLRDFEGFDLLNDEGNKVVASSDKEGFCMVDSFKFSLIEGSPDKEQFFERGCETKKVVGISIGWADVYGQLEDRQYINIRDIDSGIYWLRLTANPKQSIDELGNSASERIRINIDKNAERAEQVPDNFHDRHS